MPDANGASGKKVQSVYGRFSAKKNQPCRDELLKLWIKMNFSIANTVKAGYHFWAERCERTVEANVKKITRGISLKYKVSSQAIDQQLNVVGSKNQLKKMNVLLAY